MGVTASSFYAISCRKIEQLHRCSSDLYFFIIHLLEFWIKKLRTCKRSQCLLAPYTVDSDPESVWLTAGATSSVNRSTGLKRSQKNHSIMSAALGKDMHRRGFEVSEADQLSQPLYSYWGGGQGTAYSKNSGKAEFIFRSGSHWGISHSWWLRELELDASWEMWKLQQVYRRAETQMRGEWNNLFIYLFILNRNHEWIIQTLLLLFKAHPLFQTHLFFFPLLCVLLSGQHRFGHQECKHIQQNLIHECCCGCCKDWPRENLQRAVNRFPRYEVVSGPTIPAPPRLWIQSSWHSVQVEVTACFHTGHFPLLMPLTCSPSG